MKCRKDCYYYGKSVGSCDFYLITGIRRGCSPDNCTRYLKDTRKNTVALNLARSARTEKLEAKYQQMLTLYREGKYDKEIAAEVGFHVNTVKVWRKHNGLISQTERQRKLKEEKNNESKT